MLVRTAPLGLYRESKTLLEVLKLHIISLQHTGHALKHLVFKAAV